MCETTVLKACVPFYGSVCQPTGQVYPSADCLLPNFMAFPKFLKRTPPIGIQPIGAIQYTGHLEEV